MILCIDCRHLIHAKHDGEDDAMLCNHDDACRSLVTGLPDRTCEEERSPLGVCGEDGELFEAISDKPTSPK